MIPHLEQLIELLEKHKLRWWFDFGSALQLYRDNEFKAGDDIDIGIVYEEAVEKFVSDVCHELPGKLHRRTDKLPRYLKVRKDPKIDFLIYFEDGDTYFSVRKDDGEKRVIKRLPSKFIHGQVTGIRLPWPVREYVEMAYGSDWETHKAKDNGGNSIIPFETIKI